MKVIDKCTFSRNCPPARPAHPGEILFKKFMQPEKLSGYRLSKDINVTPIRISQIVSGKRGITADTALRLARYFGNSAAYWLNLQMQYDLRRAEDEIGKQIKQEVAACKRHVRLRQRDAVKP